MTKGNSDMQPEKRKKQEKKKTRKKEMPGIKGLVLEKCAREQGVPLGVLVDELKEELPDCDIDEILDRLMELSSSGKISVVEQESYTTFASYIFSPRSMWLWASVLATLASLALIAVTSGAGLYLRYIFGGLLIIFLPGYSLIELLYAKKKDLDDLTRVGLSIGLSFCLVILVELVLNYTQFGLGLVPAAFSLATLTLVLLFLAVMRKHSYYKLANGIYQ